MKDPTRAPFYAAMYHGLCDTARKHGYALAIHGTVASDLDLIAVPWVESPSSPQEVMEALRDHIGALTTVPVDGYEECERKPHGRLSWNLYMDFGAKVDLSVMPLLPASLC